MNLAILSLTFVGVNLDFFVILPFLLKKYRLSQVLLGYLLGNIFLLSVSYLVGQSLALFLPEWILGGLGFLPIYLALRKDDDDDSQKTTTKSPILIVLITYLSVCSGCNLAIFLPILVGKTWTQFAFTLVFIASLTIVAVLAIALLNHSKYVTQIIDHYGEKLMRACYLLIGLYVLFDSGFISHIISMI